MRFTASARFQSATVISPSGPAVGTPRAVHDAVESAQMLGRAVHRAGHDREVGEVDPKRDRTGLLRRFGERIGGHVEQRERSALAREGLGGGAADARRRARHQDSPALEPGSVSGRHGVLLVW